MTGTCRGARRELGLIRHARLAFILVGDDGLGSRGGQRGGTDSSFIDHKSIGDFSRVTTPYSLFLVSNVQPPLPDNLPMCQPEQPLARLELTSRRA
jgi:hypothetical protein